MIASLWIALGVALRLAPQFYPAPTGRPRLQARSCGRAVAGTVVNDDGDVLTVLFDEAGYRSLSKQLLAEPAADVTLRPA